jgi:isopentenyl-diphosphate delta-isomerase
VSAPATVVAPVEDLPGRDRKAEHIRLALEERMQLGVDFFSEYTFEHQALPEIDFDEIDTAVEFLGKRLAAPLLVSCMTGGTAQAGDINRNLAAGAQACGVAVGVGSQRKALEDPAKTDTFRVREVAPTVPLLANLGAVQLNYGMGLAECRRAVEMIAADALVFHLNPLQEAIQPEGQRNFKGLLPKMGAVARDLGVPVIAKEVGSGISANTARRLVACGVAAIDVAGAGGTSWAAVEGRRALSQSDQELGDIFRDWGIPTARCLADIHAAIPDLPLIASGGIRHGLDAAKAIRLGAGLAGQAAALLPAAMKGTEAVIAHVGSFAKALRIACFATGSKSLAELKTAPLL